MACIAAAVPIISTDYHGVHAYIPIDLLQAHNTIPQTRNITNKTTEMLAYGFCQCCNQGMAHKLAVRYNRSHNAGHNVIFPYQRSSAHTSNSTHSIPHCPV